MTTRSPVRLKPATVLLIEDDPDDQHLTRRALDNELVKIDLRIVENGETALDYLFQRAEFSDVESAPVPDLIFLDLNLPRIGGREILNQIKRDDRLRHIPVVVLTTSDHDTDVLQSYNLGCNSYVTKPVDLSKFIGAVRELQTYWLTLVTLPPNS